MDEGFGIERQIEPASPVFEHGQEVLPEGPIALIALLPVPRLNFKLTPLLMSKGCVNKSRFDLGWPKVDQLSVVRPAQKKIVEQLRLVFPNYAEGRLEFINTRVGDYQIKRICFPKIAASDCDRDFRSY